MFLVIVFAAEKAKLMELENKIASILEGREVQADLARTQVSELGILKQTVEIGQRVSRVPLFRYRWKVPLLSSVNETTLKELRKDFAGLEVEEVSLLDE